MSPAVSMKPLKPELARFGDLTTASQLQALPTIRRMIFLDKLQQATALNQSMLCVGLDPEPARFPQAMNG